MEIIIAVVATFFITAGWQYFAERKKNKLYAILLKGILNDMNAMAIKMGYTSTFEYLSDTKGQDYAERARQNILNTAEALLRDGEISF